jgi:hypothetical protein
MALTPASSRQCLIAAAGLDGLIQGTEMSHQEMFLLMY